MNAAWYESIRSTQRDAGLPVVQGQAKAARRGYGLMLSLCRLDSEERQNEISYRKNVIVVKCGGNFGNIMDLTGIGLYTLQEAEHLTGAKSREVSRWLFGYTFKNGASPPLWETQLATLEDHEKVIGFRDLLELRIVKAFTEHKVSLRVIRAAIENARLMFSTNYPFTANRFLTDGKSIFAEALREHGEAELTDLVKRQMVFEHIIRPELYAGIEFTASGEAKRWFPLKKSKAIVLDPEISFGKPILADYGIRTNIIAMSFAAEKSKKTVAALYSLPLSAVEAAIRYERLAA